MKKNRILAALLAAVMLASMTACGGNETKTNENDTADTTETSGADTAAENDDRIKPNLEAADFKGYEFRVLTKGKNNGHWSSVEITAEELTGEPINDAVFNRNAAVTEAYNFRITEMWGADVNCTPEAMLAIQAGEDAHDLILNGNDVTPLITAGYLLDLNSIPNMDLTQPWYDQSANEALSIGGKLPVTAGELTIMDNNATWCVQFNKDLAADMQLPDLYAMVNEGTWTMDAMLGFMENASVDLNGDGTHDEFDQWGVTGESGNTNFLMTAAGVKIVEKDENDIPYITAGSELYVDTFAKAIAINGNFDLCLNVDYGGLRGKYTDVWGECMDKVFAEGRALFCVAGMNRVTLFREMEADFGVLPMPKYTAEQSDYLNAVSMWCTALIAVPITASDPARNGHIIEAMSAESMYTLTPAYYDITLSAKSVRDEESSAMLDIIFASRVFDLGYMFAWGQLDQVPPYVTINGPDRLMSTLESKMTPATTAMQETIDAIMGN